MNYPYAKYTMTYQQACDLDVTLPEVLSFGDETKDKLIRDMVMDMYWNWEIAGETIGEFRHMLEHTFGSFKDYYSELIDAYQTKINMLDGRKTVTEVTSKGTNASTIHNEFENKTVNDGGSNSTSNMYDLPRSASSENRPSGKTVNDSTNNNTNTGSGNSDTSDTKTTTKDDTVTVTGGENVIHLKKEYMKIIRNIYKECASNLQKCFLDIFW